ncbi:hypothetical protein VTO42DRAFT_8757 [Malbranchea cinnamomea]
MTLQNAKTTRASTRKEEEDSEYCLTTSYLATAESKNVSQGESRDQPKNSPIVRSEATTPADGHSPDPFLSQSNGTPSSSPFDLFDSSSLRASDSIMLVPPAMRLSQSQLKLLLTADRLPPVTKRTLSELDLDRIMRNINLRVDVNFDQGLHFMPVDSGKPGEKRRSSKAYYEALALEMSIYVFCASHNISSDDGAYRDCQSTSPMWFEPRLPAMLETLQEVLSTLVPERDHFCVIENLNVSFLMQQIRKGVLDLVSLSTWLGDLLKTHCAPMRDSFVDRMVTEIREGCATQDMYLVAQGLRTMFGVLEAMKLDVANHQIRAFRYVLVEDTVRFLQSHFLGRIAMNTINVECARRWYLSIPCEQPFNSLSQCHVDSFEPVGVLLRGILSFLLVAESPQCFPDTFEFDAGRLWRLRNEIQDLICLEICNHIVEDITRSRNRFYSIPPEASAALRSALWSVLDDCEAGTTERSRWQNNIKNIALEIARAISMQELRAGRKDSSSRLIKYDPNVLNLVEKILESSFTPKSDRYRHFQKIIHQKLQGATFEIAKKYLNMTTLEMCNAQWHRNTASNSRVPGIEPIAGRIAHIGVLHWKVWAPLLYAREEAPSLEHRTAVLPDSNSSTRQSKVQAENRPRLPSSV